MSVPHKKPIRAANDNEPPHKGLRVVMEIPRHLPIQLVEIEVMAQLLDSLGDLAANDNEESPQ
jgi:hypothetical protein